MYLNQCRRALQTICLRLALITVVIFQLNSCQQFSYYFQATEGQLALLWQRESIESMLQRPDLELALADKLRLVKSARRFAVEVLDLPVDQAYGTYVALPRRHVVWNVQAAGEFSVRSHEWCFPVAGCVAYKGYFEEDMARRSAAELSAAGLDVYVRGVDAYSTLGWFDDPVLSSFIHYADHSLVALLFHELAHRKLYVSGDTSFNESWATAVQIMATERWAAQGGAAIGTERAMRQLQATARVSQLIKDTLQALDAVYRLETLDERQKRDRKQQILDSLPPQYLAMEADFGHPMGYRNFFSQPLNNAALLSVGHYTAWVPALLLKYRQLDSDLQQFYSWSESISKLGKRERDSILKSLQQAASA
ncbi:aminopeptidase [Allohahella sp. A8]|uniref:aminopeptidase n=1 Tax=Allohahella sp. A8 TaxID=3141461 RepID=UPI003A7F9426